MPMSCGIDLVIITLICLKQKSCSVSSISVAEDTDLSVAVAVHQYWNIEWMRVGDGDYPGVALTLLIDKDEAKVAQMTNISSQVLFISPSLLLLLSCFPLSFHYSSEYFCPSVHIVQLHCRTSLSDDWGCCVLCVQLERVFGPLCVRLDLEHEREREAVFFLFLTTTSAATLSI